MRPRRKPCCRAGVFGDKRADQLQTQKCIIHPDPANLSIGMTAKILGFRPHPIRRCAYFHLLGKRGIRPQFPAAWCRCIRDPLIAKVPLLEHENSRTGLARVCTFSRIRCLGLIILVCVSTPLVVCALCTIPFPSSSSFVKASAQNDLNHEGWMSCLDAGGTLLAGLREPVASPNKVFVNYHFLIGYSFWGECILSPASCGIHSDICGTSSATTLPAGSADVIKVARTILFNPRSES